MNRTILIFAAVFAACASGFSQTTDFKFTGAYTNDLTLSGPYVGTAGQIAADINNIATLTITGPSSSFTGGVGNLLGVTLDGGTGLRIENDDGVTFMSVDLANAASTLFKGGNGVDRFDNKVERSSRGGDGINAGLQTTVRGWNAGITAIGGNGGNIFSRAGGSNGDVSGGTGAYLSSLEALFGVTVPALAISGGTYTGGNAGTVDGQGGVAANGGDGMFMITQNAVISGGTFTGGNGNFAKVTGGTPEQLAAARADGGDGLFVGGNAASVFGGTTPVNGGLIISGGVFNGGNAGSVNLVTGERGAGLHADGSEVVITGGTFDLDGLGLLLESSGDWLVNSTANITGGNFGDIELRATDATLENTLTLGGTAKYVNLYLGGAGVNNVSSSGGAVSSGRMILTSGTANIDAWSSAGFKALLQDGTMNFNPAFSLKNGWELTLEGATTTADFKNGLTVQNGGLLTVGYGTVVGSEMAFQTGSRIISWYDGTDVGLVDVAGDLTIAGGTDWTIDIGTNALISGTDFDIAEAGALNVGITSTNITITDGVKIFDTWLDVIGLVNNGTVLTATYEQDSIASGLGVVGAPSTEYEKAVADFSSLVTPGSDAYDLIAALPDAQAAGMVISNGYIRSAEIASTLIGLQSVFADQVKSRIRSHMQYDGVGFPASSAPGGASGWDAMRDFSDRLESGSWDAVRDLSDRLESGINTDGMRDLSDRMESGINTDGMRDFSDSMEDRFGYEEVTRSVDTVSDAVIPDLGIETMGLPAEWQTWGSGYGSYIDQDTTSDFAGYQASLGGGILGIDKRINNLLLGVGGGYAHTVLQGYESKDARADSWQSVAYFSAHGDHVYLDASASYAFSSVDTEYDVLGYTGDFGAQTIGLYLGGGFAFTMLDTVVLTPETSILNTLYLREAYTESSSIDGMPDLKWDDYDQWSHLAKVGATLSPVQTIDLADLKIACRPEIRAHWLHEFNPEMDNETYIMDGGINIVGASLMAREEDLLYVGGGVRLSKWSSDTTELGLDVDGVLADNYSAYVVSGKIIHRF